MDEIVLNDSGYYQRVATCLRPHFKVALCRCRHILSVTKSVTPEFHCCYLNLTKVSRFAAFNLDRLTRDSKDAYNNLEGPVVASNITFCILQRFIWVQPSKKTLPVRTVRSNRKAVCRLCFHLFP